MLRPSLVTLLSLLVIVLTVATPLFAQQTGTDSPRLELGVDAAVAGLDGDVGQVRAAVVPRLTVNLSPRTALTLQGDVLRTRQYLGESWTGSHTATVEIRRALVQTSRLAVRGLVGGGAGWTRSFQPAYSYGEGAFRVTAPAAYYRRIGPQVTYGVGLEQRVAPRLALRQELRVLLGEASDIRAQAGVSVPFGRYAARFEPLRARSGGRPDSLANGTRIGAMVGASVMTAFVVFLSEALCETECPLAPAIAIGAGYGAGTGALAGAMIDSLIE